MAHHPPFAATAFAQAAPETAPLSGRWLELALLSLAQFMLILDVTVINVALPDLSRDIGLNIGSASWAITAYAIPFGGLMLLGGRAADLFGSRRIFLTGLVLFIAASLAAGLATDATLLFSARSLQGIGAALLSRSALATVTARFTGDERNRALAIWGAIGAVGAAVGVLLGGLLTAGPGWRWIFFINVPTGILVAILLPLLVPAIRSTRSKQQLDLIGGLLVTAAIASLIYAITVASNGTSAGAWLLPAGVALTLSLLFWLRERTATRPIIDLALLGQRPIQAGLLIMLLASGLLIGSFFLLSFLLQSQLGWNPTATGLAFLPIALGTLVGAHLAGHLVSHLGGKPVATAAFTIAAIGFAIAAVEVAFVPLLVAAMGVVALGLGAAFVAATTTAMSHVAPDETGIVSGLVNTFHELGGGLGVALLSAVAASSLAGPSPLNGLGATFAVAALIALGTAAGAFLLMPGGKPAADAPRFIH